MFQPSAMLYTQSFGSRPENIEVPHYDVRSPSPTDVNYPVGKWWLYVGNSLWYLLSLSSAGGTLTANWVQIANSAGDIVSVIGTANQITVTNSTGIVTLSIPTTFIAPGSITATNGNITATNGNIVRGTAGNKDIYMSVASTTTAGANSAGTVALAGGTATVATTAVTANSQIRIYRQGIGATGAAALGILTIGTKTAGTSFIINAVTAADATALQTSDVSTIGWEIVN